MSGTIVAIPVRSFSGGKSRLAPHVGKSERAHIIANMLDHVVETVRASGVVDRIMVVSPDEAVQDHVQRHHPPVEPIEQPESASGLDEAANIARVRAFRMNAHRLLILFGDLPAIRGVDVQALLGETSTVVIASDRTGTGTNGLLLDLRHPQTREFEFSYGPESATKHQAEARRLGLHISVGLFGGVAHDLDTKEDALALRASGLVVPDWLDEALITEKEEIRV